MCGGRQPCHHWADATTATHQNEENTHILGGTVEQLEVPGNQQHIIIADKIWPMLVGHRPDFTMEFFLCFKEPMNFLYIDIIFWFSGCMRGL